MANTTNKGSWDGPQISWAGVKLERKSMNTCSKGIGHGISGWYELSWEEDGLEAIGNVGLA